MERLIGIAHHKSPKHAKKAKKEPLKVVYISNPVRFESTAAEFRSLVQKLTGRDSEIAEMSTSDDWFPMSADRRSDAQDCTPTSTAPVSSDRELGLCEAPFNAFHEIFVPSSIICDPLVGSFWGLDEV